MMKKLFAILLVVLLYVGLAVTSSAATHTGVIGECTWTFDDATNTLTISGTGTIVNNAFSGCVSLTTFVYRGTTEPTSPTTVFSGSPLVTILVPEDYEGAAFAGMDATKGHPHSYTDTYTPNTDGTHAAACACGATITEKHTMSSTTGKCVCGVDMAVASVTISGTTTFHATL